jgi:hypothetical protein
MFGLKPRPAKPAPPPKEPRTPIPDGYTDEYLAIMDEAERMHDFDKGVAGVANALTREIIAMKARLDRLEALGQPVKEGGE